MAAIDDRVASENSNAFSISVLSDCGLPQAWADQQQWRILVNGAAGILTFLVAWRLWKDDPHRPHMLHFVALQKSAGSHDELLRQAAAHFASSLLPTELVLAEQLVLQWVGLMPGFHRLVFEGGQVLLTLCIGEPDKLLREQDFSVDSLILESAGPGHGNAAQNLQLLGSAARLCRPGSRLVASLLSAHAGQAALAQCGFVVTQAPASTPPTALEDVPQNTLQDLPRHDGSATPERAALHATGATFHAIYSPAWMPRAMRSDGAHAPGDCIVVGAGLAGAAAAASLAKRGWRVRVLDAAPMPAQGASAVPVGLLAPDHSPDDNLLSRLSRSGVRMTLQQARALLREGQDWQGGGALAHTSDRTPTAPAADDPAALAWSQPADLQRRRQALLPDTASALWHGQAAWIKPAALVRAWLAQPGVSWQEGTVVARLVQQAGSWQLLDKEGGELGRAELVVIAAAQASGSIAVQAGGSMLTTELPLQAVRGQLSWATQYEKQTLASSLPLLPPLPPFPVNGTGYFIAGVPLPGGPAWACGSSFGRGDTDLAERASDHRENLERLGSLLPAVALQVAPAFKDGRVRAWVGVRCASADRRPLVGEMAPGLWLSTAMGSRGLTFAVLCAELLAARLHAEPFPLPRRLAAALDVHR